MVASSLAKFCPSGQLCIETKVNFGSRYKRVELVMFKQGICYFFKITSSDEFDKDVLSLAQTIDSVKAIQESGILVSIVLVMVGSFDEGIVRAYCSRHIDKSVSIVDFEDVKKGDVDCGIFS